MSRAQLNLRCPASEIARLREAARNLGYGHREFSAFVRDACQVYAGLLELDEDAEQRLVELWRDKKRLERVVKEG